MWPFSMNKSPRLDPEVARKAEAKERREARIHRAQNAMALTLYKEGVLRLEETDDGLKAPTAEWTVLNGPHHLTYTLYDEGRWLGEFIYTCGTFYRMRRTEMDLEE